MDRKRNCHSKKPNDPANTFDSDKSSVTGLYYGKFSNLINKKKIKCIYEPLDNFNEGTGSLADSETNLGKTKSSRSPIEVKIFSKEDASSNRSFFDQGDLSKGCIKPSTSSRNSEDVGIAIGVQIPTQQQSKDLTVVVEFDVVGKSSTSLTELKQYTSRMKLSEETPSKMIFNGIVKLQPRAEPLQITSIPLYIIDPKDFQKIVQNPGFTVSYKTSSKPGDNLMVDKPTDVLVKLKVDKPLGNKECSCNKQKRTTVSDILMCRRGKSKGSINKEPKSAPRSESATSSKTDKNTATIATVSTGTQSNVDLQLSKSNQTTSQVSVSSGKDLHSKSNQTDTQNLTNAQSVNTVKIVEEPKTKLEVKENPSEIKKSEVNLMPTRTESKHQQKRREGWERLEKKRSKEDSKLTSRNANLSLRNAATQSSINKLTANKEISAQYSFISPTYGLFADNNLASSSSTLSDSVVPIKSGRVAQSIESTSTQWPPSLTSTDGSQTLISISDILYSENLVVPTNTPKDQTLLSSDGSGSFPLHVQKVNAVSFSTQTNQLKNPDMINSYSQYLCKPVEHQIVSFDLDSDETLSNDIKRSQETLNLLERAKFKLGEYAGNRYCAYITKPFSSEELISVCSILQSEECGKDDSAPKYIDKEADTSQRTKRQSLFTRFINRLRPADLSVTTAQYHTFCKTGNPFQLKPIPSLHDLQNVSKSNSSIISGEKLMLETMEIENVNNKLSEEINSLQKMYDDLSFNVSFIFENQDIFPIPPPRMQTGETEKRSIKTLKSDISKTFIELRSCLSTIDQILSTASLKSVYETPPSGSLTNVLNTATENDSQLNDILSHEILSTYTTVENDIKNTIKELLRESECIKQEALLNGAQEEPEPPFFFEYFDLLNEANPLLICKSIVEGLTSNSSNTKQELPKEVKEKKYTVGEKPKKIRQEECGKEKTTSGNKSIGSCSRIKTDVEGCNKKENKQKDNKKNDRFTYFCTTCVPKIPKTSFSFGGNSRSLHRETKRVQKKENVTDNTTSGDNVKIHEDDPEFSQTFLIMEPHLNTKNLSSLNKKYDTVNFESKDEVDNQNYEKNLSYANYLAYLNTTNGVEDSVQEPKNIEKVQNDTHKYNLFEETINNEIKILQLQESVLTNYSSDIGRESNSEDNVDDVPSSKDHKEESPSQPGTILKSPKSFSLDESFNRLNNLPSTSAKFYRRAETTDDEEVIREIDLTVESHANSQIHLEVPLILKDNQPTGVSPKPHQQILHNITEYSSTTSSDEHIIIRNPPKCVRKSKDLKIVVLKPETEVNMDCDSDETVLKLMQQSCIKNEQELPGSSYVLLRTAQANTNVSMQHSSKSLLGTGVTVREDSSLLSFGNDKLPTESDYEGDCDNDQLITNLPMRVHKSKPELNSPEEIERIEENVRQNDMLKRLNLQPEHSESISDDYSLTLDYSQISEYNLSDSSPEIYSSSNNNN